MENKSLANLRNYLSRPSFLFILLLLLSSFLLFFHLGGGSLWDWDEAIYASVAKEMILRGDYLSLHLNGQYWPEKTPLGIWLLGVAYEVFGISEFSARVSSAWFGLLSVVLIYLAGRRLFNPWTGFLAGLFLAGNLHFLTVARMGMLDIPLFFFISASLYLFMRGLDRPEAFLWSGAAMGLAAMTKGAAGFLPLLVIFPYLLLSAQHPLLRRIEFWGMILISLLIALPWHIQQILAHGRDFTDAYFGHHLFARAGSAIEGHSGTVFFYVKYMAEHFFTPWWCLSLLVLPAFGLKTVLPWAEKRAQPAFFLLLWLILPFMFFSLAGTKVAGYIIPCYFPLALITAKLSVDHLHLAWFRKLFAAVMAATLIHLALFFPLRMIIVDKSPEVKELAAEVPGPKARLIAYNVPPNAPAFYFRMPVREVNDLTTLEKLLFSNRDVYILCRRQEWPALQNFLLGRYVLRPVAGSRNGMLSLLAVDAAGGKNPL